MRNWSVRDFPATSHTNHIISGVDCAGVSAFVASVKTAKGAGQGSSAAPATGSWSLEDRRILTRAAAGDEAVAGCFVSIPKAPMQESLARAMGCDLGAAVVVVCGRTHDEVEEWVHTSPTIARAFSHLTGTPLASISSGLDSVIDVEMENASNHSPQGAVPVLSAAQVRDQVVSAAKRVYCSSVGGTGVRSPTQGMLPLRTHSMLWTEKHKPQRASEVRRLICMILRIGACK